MATKTRLGRDPLAAAATTAKAKRPSPGTTQKAAAKAGTSKTTASGRGKPKPATAKPDAAADQPVASAPLAVEGHTAVAPAAIGPAVVTPAVAATPPAAAKPAPPATEGTVLGPSAASTDTVPEVVEPAAAAPAPCPAAPFLQDAAIPEATSANARAVGEVHAVVSATAAPTPGGPHPAEVFLRGVLEGLTQAGSLRIVVAVDPQTYALPVEKLFYFSHVLQLLVAPMETPTDSWRRPGDGGGPVATLTVTLSPVGGGRHRLRAYDNGLFFRSYLPKIALNQETLRPLLLFVVNRDGSIRLKQGRAVEFEITG